MFGCLLLRNEDLRPLEDFDGEVPACLAAAPQVTSIDCDGKRYQVKNLVSLARQEGLDFRVRENAADGGPSKPRFAV